MFEALTLGIVQGITEWLPISSEGMIVLVQTNLFGHTDLVAIIHTALFLHLGTFFSALIYFRKDVRDLLTTLLNYFGRRQKPNRLDTAEKNTKKLLSFLIWSTVLSGALGLALLQAIEHSAEAIVLGSKMINGFIALLLIITGVLQLRANRNKDENIKRKKRDETNLEQTDGLLLGIVQGFAVLPGLSRSGLTVSTLLLRGFDDTTALRLSFLMSLPLVLAGNIILNFSEFSLSTENLIALASAFVFGLLTIHLLLKFAQKINYGYFVLTMAFLLLIAVFV